MGSHTHGSRILSALAILTLSASAAWAVADGPTPSRNVEETSTEPKVIARNSYNKGPAGQSAAKLELETATMPSFASQYAASAKVRLRKARDNFHKAAEADQEMKEAWNMLGFTSLKPGDYNERWRPMKGPWRFRRTIRKRLNSAPDCSC